MIIIWLLLQSFFCQCYFGEIIYLNFNQNNSSKFPIFDGIGAISGGGATSKLLMSYQEPYRSQILDYLFKPNFGASLHLFKVEIGGDSQSTEGTEASHSHYEGEVNCYRGYEWQLLTEAKKRNPNMLFYGLPWTFPGWVGNFTANPYFDPIKLSNYIINWLKCARHMYQIEFNFIGLWNEKTYTIAYIKTLRAHLDIEGFKLVKIIGADIKWEIARDILRDPSLADIIHAIGCHYPGTLSDDTAKKTGKKLWASEDYSTENIQHGPYCWARILNQNFVNGNMTSTIAWNLIAAYYDDLPYGRCGLMTAIEPWSGNYIIPSTIWVTAHTTQFTQPGWKYVTVGKGSGLLKFGGSYVTLISSDLSDITLIFESMSHDKSYCIRPALPWYVVKDQNVTIKFSIDLMKQFKVFYIWRTDFSSKIFYQEGYVKPNNQGEITFSLPVDNLVTISTVSNAKKGGYLSPPSSKPFPSSYLDNFEKYPLNSEPDFLSPQVGSFEVIKMPNTSKILIQSVTDQPIQWCFNDALNTRPIAVLGNFNRSDVMQSVSIMMPSVKSSNSIFLGARINNSGCTTFLAGGVFFWLNFTTSEILISSDLNFNKIYTTQKIKLEYNRWFNMSMVLRGSFGWFYLDNILVLELNNLISKSPPNGFAGLGTDKFGLAYYDNLLLKEL